MVSNPPYVAERERAGLVLEITRHEPAEALFAGTEGLDVFRRLVPAAAAAGAGLIALEVGAGQAEAVAAMVREAGFADTEITPDLAGHDRIVVGRRPRP